MPFSIHPSRRLLLVHFSGFMSLATLLLLSGGPAYAEWVVISFTKSEDGYDVYADPDTIRRKGDLVKMWILYDYKTLQSATGVAHLSDSIQLEANCTEKLQRRLAYTWWFGNMGSGNVVFFHSGGGNWIPIQPGTVGHTLWSFACSKK
jgi:hypothetical protein